MRERKEFSREFKLEAIRQLWQDWGQIFILDRLDSEERGRSCFEAPRPQVGASRQVWFDRLTMANRNVILGVI